MNWFTDIEAKAHAELIEAIATDRFRKTLSALLYALATERYAAGKASVVRPTTKAPEQIEPDTYRPAVTSRKFLRIAEVCALLGVGRSTVYNLIEHNGFPHPYQIGRRAVAWREGEVSNWMDMRPATPSALRQAR